MILKLVIFAVVAFASLVSESSRYLQANIFLRQVEMPHLAHSSRSIYGTSCMFLPFDQIAT